MSHASTKRYLRKRRVAERYDIHPRSVDRGVETGRLPKPDTYLGQHPLWDEAALDAHDRAIARSHVNRAAERLPINHTAVDRMTA
jgi:hypothetical protein